MSKGRLINVYGDATEPQKLSKNEIVIITHCCNDLGGWGKGFVLALSQKWSQPEAVYRNFCERNKMLPTLGKVCYAKIDNHLVIANMIGQDGVVSVNNPKPIKYTALIKCMAEIDAYIEMITVQTADPIVIHCPKFGSDLAQGNWNFILELIEETWLENGINVVVYEFEPNKDKWGPIE